MSSLSISASMTLHTPLLTGPSRGSFTHSLDCTHSTLSAQIVARSTLIHISKGSCRWTLTLGAVYGKPVCTSILLEKNSKNLDINRSVDQFQQSRQYLPTLFEFDVDADQVRVRGRCIVLVDLVRGEYDCSTPQGKNITQYRSIRVERVLRYKCVLNIRAKADQVQTCNSIVPADKYLSRV